MMIMIIMIITVIMIMIIIIIIMTSSGCLGGCCRWRGRPLHHRPGGDFIHFHDQPSSSSPIITNHKHYRDIIFVQPPSSFIITYIRNPRFWLVRLTEECLPPPPTMEESRFSSSSSSSSPSLSLSSPPTKSLSFVEGFSYNTQYILGVML